MRQQTVGRPRRPRYSKHTATSATVCVCRHRLASAPSPGLREPSVRRVRIRTKSGAWSNADSRSGQADHVDDHHATLDLACDDGVIRLVVADRARTLHARPRTTRSISTQRAPVDNSRLRDASHLVRRKEQSAHPTIQGMKRLAGAVPARRPPRRGSHPILLYMRSGAPSRDVQIEFYIQFAGEVVTQAPGCLGKPVRRSALRRTRRFQLGRRELRCSPMILHP